ncbi:NAD(P)H-dependent oxidoreductase [Paenibacillus xanthanilyticus]|uniref:NAD(P)H-dependent oxidoreductase n=1 Tax=Paenibacillus xanthanilyticus TaxID=1783531 RepID=A0ABV8JWV2_9BACL
MKTLVLVVHPNLSASRINRAWSEELEQHADSVTVHKLYEAYPDRAIDVAREQQLLEAHDRIVLQFPLYWYSSPPLLKQWLDEVFTYGWAYGPDGGKLKGKQFGVAVSTYGPAAAYATDGPNRFTIREFLRPFEGTAHYVGASYLPIFSLSDVGNVTDEELARSAQDYAKFVTSEHVTV